jgi:FtsP/CotA-like multicopper oxidase with cupredoxin domain
MRTSSKTVILAAALVFGLFASVFSATPAAADRTITLFGTRTGGWGLTNTSITSPGPHLEIVQGENVTLFLTSADNFNHDWFIDYNLDASSSGGEPEFPSTFDEETDNWTFSADRNGTYVYRSEGSSDGARMWGLITIHPPGASLPGSGGPPDATTLAIVGLIIAVVAVVALYMLFGRKMGRPRAPPPPPEE